MKYKKMSNSIVVMIMIVSVFCISSVFIISNLNLTKAMKINTENNIMTSLEAKAQIIEEYISNAEMTLAAFAQSGEILECLKNEEKHLAL